MIPEDAIIKNMKKEARNKGVDIIKTKVEKNHRPLARVIDKNGEIYVLKFSRDGTKAIGPEFKEIGF